MDNVLPQQHKIDKWIPWMFVAFFTVIAVLDGIFVYLAVSTQTGLVTEHAYERGLEYDDLLTQARHQPSLQERLHYEENGDLVWNVKGEDGSPLDSAQVTAKIYRPVQDGYDFDIEFTPEAPGIYKARPDFPLKGRWVAHLYAHWQDQNDQDLTYRTLANFVVP